MTAINGFHDRHQGIGGEPWLGPTCLGRGLAMTLCVVVLIASEFMPVSLLTPIAQDLGLTEGQAGQAISISGLFAVITSLLISAVIGRLDRRVVVIGMALLLAVSGTLVALAPNFLVLMIGRALLGVAIGGFWSLNTVHHHAPAAGSPGAGGLAVSNGGVRLRLDGRRRPLGSYMGDLVGWRWTFFSVVPLALAAAAWQASSCPACPRVIEAGPAMSCGSSGTGAWWSAWPRSCCSSWASSRSSPTCVRSWSR